MSEGQVAVRLTVGRANAYRSHRAGEVVTVGADEALRMFAMGQCQYENPDDEPVCRADQTSADQARELIAAIKNSG
jgi:hypothetical protein